MDSERQTAAGRGGDRVVDRPQVLVVVAEISKQRAQTGMLRGRRLLLLARVLWFLSRLSFLRNSSNSRSGQGQNQRRRHTDQAHDDRRSTSVPVEWRRWSTPTLAAPGAVPS